MYAKAEFFNPGGSVKDRIGCRSSSGRSARGGSSRAARSSKARAATPASALAIAAALRGYRCIFTMPDKMSQEKVRLLKAFGAEVIITPTAVPPDHPDSYVMMAKRIAAGDAERDSRGPVLQRRESRGALRDDGPGALGADRRAHHALRVGGGNGRHDHRRGPLPQGEEPEDPDHCRRSSGLDSRRVLAEQGREQDRRGRRTRWKASARTRFPARST